MLTPELAGGRVTRQPGGRGSGPPPALLIDAGGTLIGIISQVDLARNDSAISDRETGQVVERISVSGQRVRDEAVVARVVDRAVQQPVQPD